MKRPNRIVVLAISFLTLPVLQSTAAAEESVPVRGRLQGSASCRELNFPVLTITMVFQGEMSQLGRFSLTLPHQVDVRFLTAQGTFDFVAANGDHITGTFTGRAEPTATPNVVSITENCVVTGGTGRFAGARGTLTTHRLFDSAANRSSGSISGSISTVGKSK